MQVDVQSHSMKADLQYDTPESVLWFLSDFSVESESEVPHEDEQTVTVTHSSAVLKGALSSLSKNLSMKANSLPENPARRNYLITMHV